jgi:putative ABC transport system permease protein
MKYFRFIYRNVTRNKLRSLLTVLSIAVCLSLMTILYGFVTMQDALMPELARANRIIVMNNQGFFGRLPVSSVERVRAIPGVKAVIPLSWYAGTYQDEKMPSSQLATDARFLFDVWTEFQIDPAEKQAFLDDRQGCIIDRRSADRRGWKVGERIPLKASMYGYDIELTLRGIYDGPEFVQDMYFHWDYLDEGLRKIKNPMAGTTSILFLKADSADVIPEVCGTIDRLFQNSEHPTLSQSHQAFAQMFSKFVGNLNAYIRNIGIVVVVALILVTGNAMAMAMRERTREIAVLKAIGFTRALVLVIVLAESLVLSLAGGVVGALVGRGLWALGHAVLPQFLPLAGMAWLALALAVVLGAGIGLVSGLVPAAQAAQLPVVDGLRKIV